MAQIDPPRKKRSPFQRTAQQKANMRKAEQQRASEKKKFYQGPRGAQTGRAFGTVLDTDYRKKRLREIKKARTAAAKEGVKYVQPAPDVPEAYKRQEEALKNIEKTKYFRRGQESDYVEREIAAGRLDPITGRARRRGVESAAPETETSIGPSTGYRTPSGLPTTLGRESTEAPHRQRPFTSATREREAIEGRKFRGKKRVYTPETQKKVDDIESKIRKIRNAFRKSTSAGYQMERDLGIKRRKLEKQLERIESDFKWGGSTGMANPEYEKFQQEQERDIERAARSERELLGSYAGQVGDDRFGVRMKRGGEEGDFVEGGRYSEKTGEWEQPVRYGDDKYIIGSQMDRYDQYGRAGGIGMEGYGGMTRRGGRFDVPDTISGVTGEGPMPEGLRAGLSVAGQAKDQNMKLSFGLKEAQDEQLARKARMAIQPTDLDEKRDSVGLTQTT